MMNPEKAQMTAARLRLVEPEAARLLEEAVQDALERADVAAHEDWEVEIPDFCLPVEEERAKGVREYKPTWGLKRL